jgi:hypothetical protein
VPDVDPGRYLLLIYDGGEAGHHSTWDFVRVASDSDPASRLTDGATSEEDGLPLVILLLAAGAVVVASGLIWKRRQSEPAEVRRGR